MPVLAQAHNNLGNVLLLLRRVEEAVECYARATALEPGFAEAHSNLGNGQMSQGRREEAEESYRRAIALKPDYAEAHSNPAKAFQVPGLLKETAKYSPPSPGW